MPARCHATFLLRAAVLLTLVGSVACRSSQESQARSRPTGPSLARDLRSISFDPAPVYRQMGMIARGAPFPVVGRLAYFASATPDTSHLVLALSFSATTLRFSREADNRFRATYTVGVVIERDGQRVFASEATEAVLVGSFRETERTDENILYQEIFDVAPGTYRMSLAIRDEGSGRGIVEQVDLVVPVLDDGGLSTPMPVNQSVPRTSRDSLPYLLIRPRATAVFGQDSVLPVYIESYGDDSALELIVRGETGRQLFADRVRVVQFDGVASGLIEVPIVRLGIGVSQLSFVREGGRDTTSTYVFVGFGDELPVARFEDMLAFLRLFATSSRIQRLREAPEEERPVAWAAFMRETDSDPTTPVHEDLRDYFTKLMRANARFREEGVPGWMSDRGRVYVVLGEPDQILEPTFQDFQRGRQQVWEYRNRAIQLVFYDQTGTGRWRLTQSSEVRFESELRRLLR